MSALSANTKVYTRQMHMIITEWPNGVKSLAHIIIIYTCMCTGMYISVLKYKL